MQVCEAGLAFVKYWAAKDRDAVDVEHHFRKPLGRFEKLVRLETPERSQGVTRICFCYGDDVVRLRIKLELALEKIFQDEGVTKLGDVSDRLDILGDLCP